jgi:phosphate transport system substrate-binding protein
MKAYRLLNRCISLTETWIFAFSQIAVQRGKTLFRPTAGRIALTVSLGLILISAEGGWSQGTKNRQDSGNKEAGLQGTIRVSGAWALYPMMVKWGEEFRRIHPEVRVDISAGGAGKGIADALAGLVDIGMVSREILPEEVKRGAFYVPVVKDAVFPMMNIGNPVLKSGFAEKGIKKQTFIDLWIKGQPLTWGETVGLSTNDKIRVYTRSDSCGAAETWAQFLGGKNQEDLKGVGVYGDPGLAEAVRKDLLGIGYNNLSYAYDFKAGLPLNGLSIIPIDVNGNGKIDPEEILKTKDHAIKAISSGVYPSPPARDLYLATKESFKGLTKPFLRWILTEGQRYVDEVGYIKLRKSQVNEALKKMTH